MFGGALCDSRARGAGQSDHRRRRQPRVFKLHVNRFDEPRGRVWTVQQGGQWRTARFVDVAGVELETVFRGVESRQPRAYLRGRGVVRRLPGGGLEVRPS
jgi:hypothetical protein